ncbi:MAG: hypothetical protein IT306_12620 [Chloroflexi bacterium]|nr:hypothetical protein [Chloroflexota bacterium]
MLRVPNHHKQCGPEVETRSGRYVGYFENRHGEQLVFVYDRGDAAATLYHGDNDWEPVEVIDGRQTELILDDAELLWL